MNMTFIKNFELLGYYINACKTVKEFMHELKNYANFTEEYFHGCTFKQYMNNEYDENDAYKSVEGNVSEDVFIWIEYNDGSHFCYCDSKEGNFKLTGIKWAYISDGSGYTVYNNDLYEEWENVKEILTEEEKEAIELGISIKSLRISKALQAETEEQEQEQEQTEEQEQKNTCIIDIVTKGIDYNNYNSLIFDSKVKAAETWENYFKKFKKQKECENFNGAIVGIRCTEISENGKAYILGEIGERIGTSKAVIQAQEQAKEQKQEQEKIPFVPNEFLVKPEYKINILEALKEAGFNSGYIRKNKIFPESTVQKFRTGNTDISINTIFRVCQILNKDVSEVIAFKKE